MNWLDLGIILFVIIFVVIGIKKGFMNSLLSHFSLGINALLSFFLCKPISWIFNKCGLGSAIASNYADKLLNASPAFGENLMTIAESDLKGFVSDAINNSGLSGIANKMFHWFLNNNSLYTKLHESAYETRTLADIMSQTYASFFTIIISFVVSLILIYLIVWLFRLLVNKLRNFGFIRIVDGIMGIVYGLFRCFIVLVVICLVIKLLSPLGFMNPVTNYISQSFFGKMIYNTINSFFNNFLNFDGLVKMLFG